MKGNKLSGKCCNIVFCFLEYLLLKISMVPSNVTIALSLFKGVESTHILDMLVVMFDVHVPTLKGPCY